MSDAKRKGREMTDTEKTKWPVKIEKGQYISAFELLREEDHIRFGSNKYVVGLYGVVSDSYGSYIQNTYSSASSVNSWAKKLINAAIKDGFGLEYMELSPWEEEPEKPIPKKKGG